MHKEKDCEAREEGHTSPTQMIRRFKRHKGEIYMKIYIYILKKAKKVKGKGRKGP